MRKIDREWKFEIATVSAIIKHAPLPKGTNQWNSPAFVQMKEAVTEEIRKLPVWFSRDHLFLKMTAEERGPYMELAGLYSGILVASTITDFNAAYDEFRAWALFESYWIGN
jgi:hypothetical protein